MPASSELGRGEGYIYEFYGSIEVVVDVEGTKEICRYVVGLRSIMQGGQLNEMVSAYGV